MTLRRLVSAFSPFAVRSYRFQWSADLLTSWAFEMETVLLGWYIVVQTGSVLLVTLFGSLQFMGTLLAPFFGLAGDRIGHRRVLFAMRGAYVLLSAIGAALTSAEMLTPLLALTVAGLGGLVRPSDTGIRNVLIGETVPGDSLMAAISLSRITMDSARAAGALAGGAVVFLFGMAAAYHIIVLLNALGMLLLLGAGGRRSFGPARRGRPSPLRDLGEAARSVWETPAQLAALLMAFAVNVTAYPFTLGLLPYVARDVYGATQIGLGYMVAAVAGGSILASLFLSVLGRAVQPARTMLASGLIWHGLVIAFGQIDSLIAGLIVLTLIGVAQMLCVLPMAVLLLRGAPVALRGRIMGMRTLAVYGLPLGLLGSGSLIDHVGLAATAAAYGAAGIVATLLTLLVWRSSLLPQDAAANEG